MAEAFRRPAPRKKANAAGPSSPLQMQRLVASDVIWEDLFKDPTKNELDNLDITGVNVPDSIFLRERRHRDDRIDEVRLAADPRRRDRRRQLRAARYRDRLDGDPAER